MKARHLKLGMQVPSGTVDIVERHTGAVVVVLTDGRVWVYGDQDEVMQLNWWIGRSVEADHRAQWGPFATRHLAEAFQVECGAAGQVFPLPKGHGNVKT